MHELIWLLAATFFVGIVRGSSVCATICAPGLVSYITSKRWGRREGFTAGLIFNAPRIVLLTGLGALIGILGFELVHTPQFNALALGAHFISYLVLGIILTALGAYMFAQAAEDRNLSTWGGCAPPRPPGANGLMRRDTLLLTTWGAVLGSACILEIGLIETPLLVGAATLFVADAGALGALALGAAVMFTFAIGAALPVIAMTTCAGELSTRIKAAMTLNKLKTVGSFLMMLIGLALILTNLSALISWSV